MLSLNFSWSAWSYLNALRLCRVSHFDYIIVLTNRYKVYQMTWKSGPKSIGRLTEILSYLTDGKKTVWSQSNTNWCCRPPLVSFRPRCSHLFSQWDAFEDVSTCLLRDTKWNEQRNGWFCFGKWQRNPQVDEKRRHAALGVLCKPTKTKQNRFPEKQRCHTTQLWAS